LGGRGAGNRKAQPISGSCLPWEQPHVYSLFLLLLVLTWHSLIKQKPRGEDQGKPGTSAFDRQGVMRGRWEGRGQLLLDEACEQES